MTGASWAYFRHGSRIAGHRPVEKGNFPRDLSMVVEPPRDPREKREELISLDNQASEEINPIDAWDRHRITS